MMTDTDLAMRLEKVTSLLAAAIPKAHVNLLFEENDDENLRFGVFSNEAHKTPKMCIKNKFLR